jgi:hypothetical protein
MCLVNNSTNMMPKRELKHVFLSLNEQSKLTRKMKMLRLVRKKRENRKLWQRKRKRKTKRIIDADAWSKGRQTRHQSSKSRELPEMEEQLAKMKMRRS